MLSPHHARWLLGGASVAAFLLVVQNFCLSILPDTAIPLDPAKMRPVAATQAFTIEFPHGPGDTMSNPRSRAVLTENGIPLTMKVRLPGGVHQASGTWCHFPGGIVFSTADSSDPRTNGRRYVVYAPMLFSRAVGYGALAVFISTVLVLRRLQPGATRPETAPRSVAPREFRTHVLVASVVFTSALYLNTGTLAPYANTLSPVVHVETGYLYNIDHAEHRTLYAFVNGEPRGAWERSLLLRRIVHAVMARPWMNAFGHDIGGVLFNLGANLLGFAAGVAMVRRHVGVRGAVLAAWLLALYPGAGYWVGQPYLYGLIFPLSIVGFWLLLELPSARPARVALLSLTLGVVYLAYDLHAFFFPASLLLLVWSRRSGMVVLSVIAQALPLTLWLWLLKEVVRVPMENSNAGIYRDLVSSFFSLQGWSSAGSRIALLPEAAADVFFGANFLFLPLLTAAAWAFDLSRAAFTKHRAVPALIAAACALFFFCNFPPPHQGAWNLQGSWIARLYQPVFPALVFSLALWWEESLPAHRLGRVVRMSIVAFALLGNALICFGPALGNPLRISEHAFYRFYDHTDRHWLYERNLAHFGRRPLGFPRQVAP